MAHSRVRYLDSQIIDQLKWSPAVGLFGLRQVGKSTLVKSVTEKKSGEFADFDRLSTKQEAEDNSLEFCTRSKLLTIDEVQRVPKIFFAIKEVIGTKRIPGRFLMTGSIRFTLKKAIQESLTGRILLNELLPFNLSEIHQKKPSNFLEKLFICSRKPENTRTVLGQVLKGDPRFSRADIEKIILRGGLPIASFTANKNHRERWFEDYFETLLGRDLSLAEESLSGLSIRQGKNMLQAVALMQGRELRINDVADAGNTHPITAKRFIQALELLCLIDLITPLKVTKTAIKKARVEWKDIGLWQHLTSYVFANAKNDQTIKLLLTQEFRTQLTCSDKNKQIKWGFYKSHESTSIPWIFSNGDRSVALIYIPTEAPKPYEYRVLKQFVEKQKNSIGIVLGGEKSNLAGLSSKIWLVPYDRVF